MSTGLEYSYVQLTRNSQFSDKQFHQQFPGARHGGALQY